MKDLNCTLIADGSSDKCLLRIIIWLLEQHFPDFQVQAQWADLRRIPNKKLVDSLDKRIAMGIELYPCEILFIHRDAETETIEKREQEIYEALGKVTKIETMPKIICVIPVRMLESWLIFDEIAIRRAADNPSGKVKLKMPPLKNLEEEPNPKNKLHNLLEEASELPRRRLEKFKVHQRVHRVAELIDDFSPLLQLPAFKRLENHIQNLNNNF
jgi:Domain of unknown function (DUF4276)